MGSDLVDLLRVDASVLEFRRTFVQNQTDVPKVYGNFTYPRWGSLQRIAAASPSGKHAL